MAWAIQSRTGDRNARALGSGSGSQLVVGRAAGEAQVLKFGAAEWSVHSGAQLGSSPRRKLGTRMTEVRIIALYCGLLRCIISRVPDVIVNVNRARFAFSAKEHAAPHRRHGV